jgi:glycine oxidase
MKSQNVVIVGGGIMGCAAAWQLARRGASVTVLERSVPGAEASSAAAGILGAQLEASGPGAMAELALESRKLYPRWSKALAEETGIDVGYRKCGILRVALDAAGAKKLSEEAIWQRRQGQEAPRIGGKRARAIEPALARGVAGGVHFAEDGRIDPPLLLRALHIAAARAGASFRTGAYVRRVLIESGRARGVLLEDGQSIGGDAVVVAAGSWTTLVEGVPLRSDAVRPARGQIVELASSQPLLRGVVFGPRCYLVPRDDGRTLVGSTLEFVGYRRGVTAGAVRDLLDAAIELVPALAEAALSGTWSSFRPYTEDHRPLIGPTQVPGLALATGHYRNGILLAPITAEIVARTLLGGRSPIDLSPFDPARANGRAGAVDTAAGPG